MAKEFIQNKVGNSGIVEARRQQEQLAYFTQSQVQKDITQEYIEKFAERNYASNDEFLNWVKTVFRTSNFLSFFKHFRSPLASATLINDRIKPQLERVFFSEDAHFKYIINNQEEPAPEELNVKEFNEWIFNALLFRHNDILITDLRDVNDPFRQLISIKNVVAIESHRSIIKRLAYSATVIIVREGEEPKEVMGTLFMDAENYIFFDKDLVPLMIIPHDLGQCPADYVAREPFANDDIVRKSLFSYVRGDFEEYVFLKTLQRMTDPNGSIPIITKLKFKEKDNSSENKKGLTKEPMTSNLIGGQQAEVTKEVTGSDSIIQAGSIVGIPPIKKTDGSLDMDAVKNFLNFFHHPVEALNYLKTRIAEIEGSLIVKLLGDLKDQNSERKNELQIRSGFVTAEDKLRTVSLNMSRIRQRSDFKMLALKFGPDRVSNEAFYGSDFFLETQGDLYDLFDKSPNPIERKNILIRLSKNRNRFNKDRSSREEILYHLIPYVADKDFQSAVDKQALDPATFQYQTRFPYWIGVFESQFGDILVFWENIEGTDSEKFVLINNLILNIIEPTIVSPPAEETVGT